MVPPCWYEIWGTWQLDVCSLTCVTQNIFKWLPSSSFYRNCFSWTSSSLLQRWWEMVPECVMTLEVNKTTKERLLWSVFLIVLFPFVVDSILWKMFYVSGCFFVALQNMEEWEVGRCFTHTTSMIFKLMYSAVLTNNLLRFVLRKQCLINLRMR